MPTVRKYSSRSQQTSLTSAVNASATTIIVGSGTSLLGGATVSSPEIFTVVIDPDTALEEIVDITAVSTNTLTVVRGRDGSSGQAHSAGAVVRHMAIGRDYREANDHINENTTAHGLTLADVTLSTGTGNVSTQMLASNAVTTVKITDANVTTAKIADSAITSAKIADLTIATGDIADSAITSGKIATGAVGTTKIDDLSVTEGKLAPTAVTTGKIADSAVTSAKIADGTIVAGDIADGAITSAKILDGTIATGDIADSAITSAKIADGTIVAGDLADGAVTSAKILDGTIVNADVNADAAIAKSKLNLGGTITSADLVDGTIVASDIADGTITAAKMVSDPYARANHTGTQAASTISDFDTQVRTSRLDQMAAPTGSVSLNSQKVTSLATPTDNADAATKLYVDTKVADLVNSAPSTLDTLGEIATAIQAGGTVYDSFVLKAGSTMTGALTLSGAPTVDLHAATKAYVDTVAGSATAAAASAAAAATTYDNFDDRYLGAKSTAPSVDNDGNALLTGAIYWNSVSNAMYAWTGTEWGSISSTADIFRYRYTASGGETSKSGLDDNGLTLSYIPGKEQVYLNGVLLVRTTDYNATNGTSITGLAALTAGDILEVVTFTAFELANVLEPTLFDAKGDLLAGTGADTVGKLTVGSNGTVLVADSSTATGLKWSAYDPLPSQTGNTGKYLTTDGSTSSWGEVDLTTLIPKSTVTTKGDLLVATGSGTVVRQGVGTDGQVLTANSAQADGVEWTTLSIPKSVVVRVPAGTAAGSVTATNTFSAGTYQVSIAGSATSTSVGALSFAANGIGYLTTTGSSVTVNLSRAWVTRTSPVNTSGQFNSATYGNGIYVLGGYDGTNATIVTSTDTITWTTRNATFGGTNTIYRLAFANNLFIGTAAGLLATSTDAITWTTRSSGSTSTIRGITYGNGLYVTVGDGPRLHTSPDAITWTARTPNTPATVPLLAATYGTVYVIAGGNGGMSTSTNGITWTTRSAGIGGSQTVLLYAQSKYAVGSGSGYATSTDAITWTVRGYPLAGSASPNSLTFGNNLWMMTGDSGTISTSTDGITWTARSSNTSASLYASTYGASGYLATGQNGDIRTSTDGVGATPTDSYAIWDAKTELSYV